MNNVLAFQQTFVHSTCITCGVLFAVPSDFDAWRLKDHKAFYCPNGHSQNYVGKTEEQKLREQLAEKERQLEFERQRAATNYAAREKAERRVKKMERRAKGGVCPCCNRSFTALTRHMKTKHPDFGLSDE